MNIKYGCHDLNRICRSCCKSVSLCVICVSCWVAFFSCPYAWKQLTIRGILEGWRNCTKWIIFTVECDTALIQMIHCAADTILQLSFSDFPGFPQSVLALAYHIWMLCQEPFASFPDVQGTFWHCWLAQCSAWVHKSCLKHSGSFDVHSWCIKSFLWCY